MTQDSPGTGLVFDIKRFAIHDGPGIRTTVFFKGCPLQCAWCQNPEGISPDPELVYDAGLCVNCGRCAETCPHDAHSVSDGRHAYDRRRCRVCGACADLCPTEALRLAGRKLTTAQVMDVALRDRLFYEKSGGGITLSGGEPMMQSAVAEQVLAAARAEGLHTCVDTSGFAPWTDFEPILQCVDLFLYDLKDTDEGRHQDSTGVGLEVILDNLRRLASADVGLVLRCPIVPGVNDEEEHFGKVAALWQTLESPVAVEIVPYHPLGLGKWQTLGKAPACASVRRPPRGVILRWADALRAYGVEPVEASPL